MIVKLTYASAIVDLLLDNRRAVSSALTWKLYCLVGCVAPMNSVVVEISPSLMLRENGSCRLDGTLVPGSMVYSIVLYSKDPSRSVACNYK